MVQRRGVRAAGLAVAVFLVLLAACGEDESPTIEGVGQAPPTDAPGTPGAVPTTAGGPEVRTVNNAKLGTILVNGSGFSLYTFDRDTSTTSTCTGGCATTWPPLLLPVGVTTPTAGAGVTGALATAPRPDGSGTQIAYNGKPLYLYSQDTSPGDVNGDGVGGTWHVAKP